MTCRPFDDKLMSRISEMIDSRTMNAHTGAWGELAVAADLMQRGYEVFRNLSPAGPVDMVVLKDERLWRVQVKVRTSLTAEHPGCDVLAVVDDREIKYIGDNFEPAIPRRKCRAEVNTQGHSARCKAGVRSGDDYCYNHRRKNIVAAAAAYNRSQLPGPSAQ